MVTARGIAAQGKAAAGLAGGELRRAAGDGGMAVRAAVAGVVFETIERGGRSKHFRDDLRVGQG